MKIDVQIHPTASRHEFAAVDLILQSLDAKIPLDLNFEPYLRYSLDAPAAALDLLLISAVVYAADKAVSREYADDRWTRSFEISMPVHTPAAWNAASDSLGQCLSFLTGDRWTFTFTQTDCRWIRRRANRRIRPRGFPSAPVVSLLSGGLDSFVGALDLLHDNPGQRLLFASHYDGKVAGPAGDQKKLEKLLQQNFSNRLRHLQIKIGILKPHRISQPTSQDWQDKFKYDLNFRSRSFTFLGIGILAAHKAGAGTPVWIPENGPIALNMPLNPSRRGSCSTRTVHPYFISLVQSVLDAVGMNHRVSNPYALHTKGEMVAGCKEPNALKMGYELTNSCAKAGHKVHWKVRTAKACGRCVPCLFRRASLHVAGLDDEVYGNDVLAGKGNEFEDFYALLGLIRRNPDDAEIARALLANGRLPISELDDFVAVERRMIEEVRSWLSAKASKAIKTYARIK